MKNRRVYSFMFAAFSFALSSIIVGTPGKAAAVDCVALGGTLVGGECQINSAQVKSGTFTLNETLHILGAGSITVPPLAGGNTLTLNITGDLIMDIGSEISGDASGAAGTGATITVNASRHIILEGNGAVGARITSNQTGGSCSTGKGGDIILAADADGNLVGDARVEAGAEVTANAKCSGGEITITGVDVDIDGLVESRSMTSGTGGSQRPGGGPITIDASCDLTITGKVSSRGIDPGAGLVHVEGGCVVRILGLVEATGSGHGIPSNPPTLCSTRPGKPANTTACVEVVAGNELIIDSTGPNNGEINADTGGPGGSAGTSFIDIFARGDITILGNNGGTFAVHANGLGGSNDEGGDVTVKSVTGEITASGRALQADAIRPGGSGGTLVVEADENVTLNTAILFARGDFNPIGGLGSGGTAALRSFNGSLSFQNGEADVRPSATGTITLTSCGAITTTGTNFNGVTPGTAAGVCGGAPTIPPYIVLPDCLCGGSITVTKTCQCQGPPLGLFTTVFSGMVCNNGTLTLTNVTLVDDKAGPVPLIDTTLDPGECVPYNGTFMTAADPSTDTVIAMGTVGGQTVTAMASATCDCVVIPPPVLPPPPCPSDAGHDPIRPLTSVVDPLGIIMGFPSFPTLQAAVNAADPDEVIGIFGDTTENVTIGGNKRLFITQCTTAEITAANPGAPVVDISSSDVITITSVDTDGGTIGFLIQTDDHVLRGVRATNASVAAISILGSNNSVSFNSLDDSGAGLIVSGDANDIRGGTVANNVSNGVQLTATASSNTFRGAKVLNNGGNGILVQGSGNTIRDNGQVNNNSLDGLNVTGAGNRLKSDRASNNTGDEFDIGPGNVDQGGNKANGVNCTFGAGGGVCN